MTAIRLRLDELSTHEDPMVVEEAEAAMAQVDRLTAAIDGWFVSRGTAAPNCAPRCRWWGNWQV